MRNYTFLLLKFIAIQLSVFILASSRNVLEAQGHPLISYSDEYVVKFKPYSKVEGKVHQLGAGLSTDLHGRVTLLKSLNRDTALISRSNFSPAIKNKPKLIRSLYIEALSSADLFCKQLIAEQIVESCTPNYQLRTQVGESDPMVSEQWGLRDQVGVGASSAWNLTTGSQDVVIAVIDTGIDYNHPDLADNIWINPGEVPGNGIDDDGNGYIDDIHGANTLQGAIATGDPMDDNRHGTHIAGIIGAIGGNGIGIMGINQRVKLMPIKFMDASGAGRLSDAITAIYYMIDMKVNHGVNIKAVNNSWGGGGFSQVLEDAISRANDAGIAFVVAAGNDAMDTDLFPTFPASYQVPNIVSVAAIDQNQNLATFSNYGASSVHIAAPGVGITSTLPGGLYGQLSGTSMAAPHVTGSLGLLYTLEPNLPMADLVSRLMESGRDVDTLANPERTMSYVKSRRVVSATRLLEGSRIPIANNEDSAPSCGYDFEISNLADAGGIDTAADASEVVNQVDEGGFYQITLPFDFPFFKTITRTLYVSPNGVLYLNPPRNIDYQVAKRAPHFSIAAFHTDLTPRASNQGVRVHINNDRATIFWLSEQYSLSGAGPIAIRLTIYKNGLVRSSISFEHTNNPSSLWPTVLGNGLVVPPTSALGLIGVSAGAAKMSTTLDIGESQRKLVKSIAQRLDLGISMVPNCFSLKFEQPLETVRVDRIRLSALTPRKMTVNVTGAGNGRISIMASVNGRVCSGSFWGNLKDGRERMHMSIPSGARKISMSSSGVAATLGIKKSNYSNARNRHSRMCTQLLRASTR